jgi:hypothetical protein
MNFPILLKLWLSPAAQLVGSLTIWDIYLLYVRGQQIVHLIFPNLNLFNFSIKCVFLMVMYNKLLFDRIVVEPSM